MGAFEGVVAVVELFAAMGACLFGAAPKLGDEYDSRAAFHGLYVVVLVTREDDEVTFLILVPRDGTICLWCHEGTAQEINTGLREHKSHRYQRTGVVMQCTTQLATWTVLVVFDLGHKR